MTLQQLRYALTIAETSSMNKAAEKLYISQPTLTNAIRELESDIGITIFLRSGRGMTVTNEGAEFLSYASQMMQVNDLILEKYGKDKAKRKFCVSTQHYSFAVSAFVETVKQYGMSEYEFALRETRTRDVIRDVGLMKSEVGVLYLSDYNRKVLTKYLADEGLVFNHLIDCQAYAYLWKGHPLADRESISLLDLTPYPCLSFEQGHEGSSFFAEEILPESAYPRLIKCCDRATILNLMVGLNGYTLCSGIICEELNGSEFIAVPFRDPENPNSVMDIGYIVKRQNRLSEIGRTYIEELKNYLANVSSNA